MKTFLVRLSSGLIATAIAVFLFLFNQYTFLLLMSIILIGSLYEFFTITESKRQPAKSFFQSKWFVILLCFIVLIDAFLLALPQALPAPDGTNYLLVVWHVLTGFRSADVTLNISIPIVAFILFVTELFSKSETPFENLGWKSVAIFWIFVPVVLTINIYFKMGGAFILAMFFTIWVYDSFCYIFGSLLGRTKLFERVSPKKTWEGSIGGATVTLIAAYFANLIPALRVLSPVEWVILALVIVITATFGDLVESLLKRNLGIKDSGNILPGHGGFLDRLDSFYLAIPFVALTLWLMEQIRNLYSL